MLELSDWITTTTTKHFPLHNLPFKAYEASFCNQNFCTCEGDRGVWGHLKSAGIQQGLFTQFLYVSYWGQSENVKLYDGRCMYNFKKLKGKIALDIALLRGWSVIANALLLGWEMLMPDKCPQGGWTGLE